MKPLLYIETTVPRFYFETRPEPEMVAGRNWTREWRDFHSHRFRVVTSPAVIEELEAGNYQIREAALSLISSVELLSIGNEIVTIVETYIRERVMPADPAGDAMHLAVASYYSCDYLLTWNCKHLANANKFVHIRHVNDWLGLGFPTLLTPLELIGE